MNTLSIILIILIVLLLAAMAVVIFMAEKRLHDVHAQYQQMLDRFSEANQKALDGQREIFNKSISEMKQSMIVSTEDALKKRQEEFAQSSGQRISQLLDPLKRDLESMQKAVVENKEKQIELQGSMETRIAELLKQSNLTAQSANTLADALKNRGKVHGDWGEHVLEDILQGSGLREGYEYTIQTNVKDENDANLRPDVVINCPDGKHIILDAKTSLTAYTEALGAETEIEREEAVKRHYKSVKLHVDELSKKQYQTYVENAMHFVLMFIPNEGAYVMAINHNSTLLQEAYQKGVIIVNPSNLMLTLYLVLQAWQQTHQEDNCRLILQEAGKMYNKMVTVVDSFTTLGNQLNTVSNTYKTAIDQLCEGRDNLFQKLDRLRDLGVPATKSRTKTLNPTT